MIYKKPKYKKINNKGANPASPTAVAIVIVMGVVAITYA